MKGWVFMKKSNDSLPPQETNPNTLPFMIRFLRNCGHLYSFLYVFPFYFALNGILAQPYSDGMAILGTVVLVAAGFLGVFCTSFCRKKGWEEKTGLFHFLRILMVLLIAGISFVAFLFQGWPWAAVCAVFHGGIFFWGTVSFYREYKYMISSAAFVASIPCFGFCIMFPFLAERPYNVTLSVTIFILLTALYGIIKNQINIDQHMEVRRHSKAQLPEKIRRYNTTLLVVPFVLLLLLFLLRKYLILAIGWIWKLFMNFFGLLRQAYDYIQKMIFRETKPFSSGLEEESYVSSTVVEPSEDTAFSPVWNVILWAGMIFLVIFLLVTYREYIAEAFRKVFRFFRNLFAKLFQSFDFIGGGGSDSEYYSDSEETLNSHDIKAQRKPTNRQAVRQWKQDVKEFLRKDNSPEYFRDGYRLVLDWLRMKEIPILTCDTPNEIWEKSKDAISDDAFLQTTDGYNRLRYGELVCDITDLDSLRNTLKTLQTKMK